MAARPPASIVATLHPWRHRRRSFLVRLSCLLAAFLISPLASATAGPLLAPNADTGGPGGGSPAQFTVSRLFDEVFTGQHGEVCTELMTADVSVVTPTGIFHGPDGFNAFAATIWTAFPDAVFVMDNVYESDGAITVRWSMTGTHLGPLAGQVASGNSISLQGLALFHFDQNRIAASWIEYDRTGLFEQITAPPALPPTCAECQDLPF